MRKAGTWLLAAAVAGCVAGPRVAEQGPADVGAEPAVTAAKVDASADAEESPEAEEAALSEPEQIEPVLRLMKERRYFRDGTLDGYTEYHYHASGLLIREERFGGDDELLESTEYHYDDFHLIEKRTYQDSVDLKSVHRYTYTPEGFVESDGLFDADDRMQITSRYAYDPGGNKLRWEIYDSTGTLMAQTDYLYKDGLLVRIEIFTGGGFLSDYSAIEYNEQGFKIRESYYTVPKKLTKYSMYEYTEDMLDIESDFDAEGNLTGKTLYQYDEGGILINTIYLDGEENVKEIVEREYAGGE